MVAQWQSLPIRAGVHVVSPEAVWRDPGACGPGADPHACLGMLGSKGAHRGTRRLLLSDSSAVHLLFAASDMHSTSSSPYPVLKADRWAIQRILSVVTALVPVRLPPAVLALRRPKRAAAMFFFFNYDQLSLLSTSFGVAGCS